MSDHLSLSGVWKPPWWVERLPAWVQPVVVLDLYARFVGADDEHTPRGRD